MTQPAQRAKLGTARSCCCHVTNPQKITMFFLLPAPFEKKVIPLKGIPEAQASLQLGFETSKSEPKHKKMVLHRVCVSKPKYLGKILHDVKEKKSGSWELQSLYLEPNQEVLKMSVTKNSKVFD